MDSSDKIMALHIKRQHVHCIINFLKNLSHQQCKNMPDQLYNISVYVIVKHANIEEMGDIFYAKDTDDLQCQNTDEFAETKTITKKWHVKVHIGHTHIAAGTQSSTVQV